MPSDLLQLVLTESPPAPVSPVSLRAAFPSDRVALAAAHFAAYPRHVACATLDEAQREIDATFAGEFGTLRTDASAAVLHGGEVIGGIFVVERSVIDGDPDCPYILDLFVRPDARGLGSGRSLINYVIRTCHAAGDTMLALRFGEGTSEHAKALYREAGFRPV